MLVYIKTQDLNLANIYIGFYMYSGKPETINQYWLVSKIYRTAGQIGIAFGTVLTSLIKLSSIHFAKKKKGLLLHKKKKKSIDNKIINLE